MSRVADKAGLERTHLYRKLKQLNIRFARRGDDGAGLTAPPAATAMAHGARRAASASRRSSSARSASSTATSAPRRCTRCAQCFTGDARAAR